MQVRHVPIDSVTPDPANVRKHDKQNVDRLAAILKRFGQQKPIVVDQHGIVRAGNGTLAAAKSLGWTTIAIVISTLAATELTAYAIADNRSAELSEFDGDALKGQLMALKSDGLDLDDLGFDSDDLDELIGGDGSLQDPATSAGAGVGEVGDKKYMVLITAKSEADQGLLLERFTAEGLECKALAQ